jgi:hypothetical protein
VDLAFLKDGPYRSLQVRDDPAQAASLEVETGTARGGDVLTVALRGAGGFVARFVPEP